MIMTQEEKDLLLKDLCGRLPYSIKASYYGAEEERETWDEIEGITLDGYVDIGQYSLPIECIKPYLFPLSSMTDEQREELYKIGWYLDEDKIYSCFRNYDDVNYKTHIDCFELMNWCYKNNFDINGLIPMGLANDATGLNIY
jgi:hypothetical protein